MAASLDSPGPLVEPRTLRQVHDLQQRRWAALVRHLRQRPSYRGVLSAVESNRSPGKAWYRNIDRRALLELGRALYYIDTSSGTTGSPKSRYVSIGDDRIDLRLLRRTLQYAGIRSNDVVLVLDIGDLNLYSMVRRSSRVNPSSSGGCVHHLDQLLPRPCVRLNRPSCLPSATSSAGAPSNSNCINRGLGDCAASCIRVRHCNRQPWTCSTESDSSASGSDSSIELGFIGAECHAHDGMHIWEDVFRISLTRTRRTTRRIFKRQESDVRHGVFSATALLARAKPALRYSTGDAVWYTRQRCACGSALPRIMFDRRSHEVISLYGAKVTFDEVYRIVYDEPDLTNFLQLRVSEQRGVTRLTLVLPSESLVRREDRRQRLLAALQSYPGLAFLCDHGVVTFECEFQSASYFDRRKLNKVVDSRTP